MSRLLRRQRKSLTSFPPLPIPARVQSEPLPARSFSQILPGKSSRARRSQEADVAVLRLGGGSGIAVQAAKRTERPEAGCLLGASVDGSRAAAGALRRTSLSLRDGLRRRHRHK